MKAYGFNRRDKLTCKYGCCTLNGDKHRNSAARAAKEAKKTARADARKFIAEEV